MLCLLVKAYLNVSYRRLTGFLRALRPYLLSHGTSTHLPCNRMRSMEYTLKSLLGHTAEGVWKEESAIAIDSSGLLLHCSGSWRSSRYREGRIMARYMCFQAPIDDTGCKDWRHMA